MPLAADFYTSLSPYDVNLFSTLLRIFLSVIIGGVLGMERGRKRHPAGLRTYILVCLGATIVMTTNQYLWQIYGAGDIGRMGAQVISGIGFLGAGTIMVTGRNQIRGLTTAAGLWAAACVGLAIGIGFYVGAVIGGAAIFCVIALLQRFEERVNRNSKILDLYLEFESPLFLGAFITTVKEREAEVSNVQLIKDVSAAERVAVVLLTVRMRHGQAHEDLLQVLGCAQGVLCIQEIQ